MKGRRIFAIVDLTTQLNSLARADQQSRGVDDLILVDFVILDELSSPRFVRSSGPLLLRLVSRHNEQTSRLISTGLAFCGWP